MNSKVLNAGQIVLTTVLVTLTIGGMSLIWCVSIFPCLELIVWYICFAGLGTVGYGGVRVYNRKQEVKAMEAANKSKEDGAN
jgi:hypothetical protein